MANLDVLFVHPGGAKKIYQSLSGSFSAIEPPFLAALTADFVRNNGFEAGILDSNALNLDIEETAHEVAQRNPRLVSIVVHGQQPSASTQLMSVVGPLCSAIKNATNPNSKIILTGTHPSALPERTMKEEACDFVGVGEGFYTILGLLQEKDFSEVPGLWHRNNGNIVAPKTAAKDVEEKDMGNVLRGVAWDLLPMDKYRAHNWHCFDNVNKRQPYASLYTSFGCPYRCTFCCINAPFSKHMIRCFSPDWSIEQIKILNDKYKVRNIKIIDEMFVLRPDHVDGICNRILNEKLGDSLNIWAYARIDTARERFLEKLGKSGFRWLGLGIESGSKHVRDGVEKCRFTEEDIVSVVRKIQSFGISIGANFIFGLPDDTYNSMQETFALATHLNAELANFYCAMAYPGSNLYGLAKQKGLPLPDDAGGPGWIGYSQHAYETLPLPTETLSAAQVLEFRDYAHITYFTNPRYLYMIEKKFGLETVAHIKEMNTHRLKRKLLGD